jgi:ATP-binding cassette subfamily F protein 3
MVSHDRHLLATVTDRFLLVDGGRVEEFDGDLDDYARWLARGGAGESAPAPSKPAAAPKPAAQNAAVKPSGDRRNPSALRSRLARVEKRMGELAQLAKELDAKLADPALYGTAQRALQVELTAQRARVAQETDEVEAEWLQLSEELENAG